MAHFSDLSLYIYFLNDSIKGSVNIGWLTKNVPFKTGTPPPGFLPKLLEFCKVSFIQTRGLHDCDICGASEPIVEYKNNKLRLGSAEIRVLGKKGQVYCAPNLIYHYVAAHNYSPPDEFIHAVLTSSPDPDHPFYKEYFERVCLEITPTLGMNS